MTKSVQAVSSLGTLHACEMLRNARVQQSKMAIPRDRKSLFLVPNRCYAQCSGLSSCIEMNFLWGSDRDGDWQFTWTRHILEKRGSTFCEDCCFPVYHLQQISFQSRHRNIVVDLSPVFALRTIVSFDFDFFVNQFEID